MTVILMSLLCTETPRETTSITTDQNYFLHFFSHFVDKTARLRTAGNEFFCSTLKRAISRGENNESSAIRIQS